MNERIRELADRANGPNPFFGPLKNHMVLLGDEAVEKFAELIVRECIDVAGPEDSYTDQWFSAKADSVEKIKKHFGVEE